MEVKRTWARIAKYMTPEKRERFWARVDKRGPDECWPWTGSTNKQGYGCWSFKSGEGPINAHRIAYGLTHNGIPGRLHILHSCDNPPCCNPAHLDAGTHADNMVDMRVRGRAGWQQRDLCECGNDKLAVSLRCSPCQNVVIRVRQKKWAQLESGRKHDARLEALWQVAIKLPPTRSKLVEALDGDERRAQVLIRIYGLYGQPHLSLTEIGNLVGISRERVRQMRDDAFLLLGMESEVPRRMSIAQMPRTSYAA